MLAMTHELGICTWKYDESLARREFVSSAYSTTKYLFFGSLLPLLTLVGGTISHRFSNIILVYFLLKKCVKYNNYHTFIQQVEESRNPRPLSYRKISRYMNKPLGVITS
jgi:hypothetical protein